MAKAYSEDAASINELKENIYGEIMSQNGTEYEKLAKGADILEDVLRDIEKRMDQLEDE